MLQLFRNQILSPPAVYRLTVTYCTSKFTVSFTLNTKALNSRSWLILLIKFLEGAFLLDRQLTQFCFFRYSVYPFSVLSQNGIKHPKPLPFFGNLFMFRQVK